MISTSKNFIFVHIPKTGGNSIQNVLKKYSDDKIVITSPNQDGVNRFEVRNNKYNFHKHSTLQDYKNELDPIFFKNAFKIATIRNPWDRLISYYFSPHRNVEVWDRTEFLKMVNEVKSYEKYTNLLDAKPLKGLRKFFEPKQIRDYAAIDFKIRFENLEEDFKKLCSYIDVEYEKLAVNNSSMREHYSKYYDDELIEIVRTKFSNEVALGNYQFEYDNQ